MAFELRLLTSRIFRSESQTNYDQVTDQNSLAIGCLVSLLAVHVNAQRMERGRACRHQARRWKGIRWRLLVMKRRHCLQPIPRNHAASRRVNSQPITSATSFLVRGYPKVNRIWYGSFNGRSRKRRPFVIPAIPQPGNTSRFTANSATCT